MTSLLIRGGRLFDPGAGLDAVGDLLIRAGVIAAVGRAEVKGAGEVIEAGGLLVVPGLMDMHVHLREPGQEQKETIATGTRAAAGGGFATVVCEPNTIPPRDSPERIAEVIELAGREGVVRVLPKGCITRGQQGREVTNLAALRAAGAVAASDDGLSVVDDGVMREAMRRAKEVGIPLTVHVDWPGLMERDIGLAAETGCGVHFSHVSLAEEVELIARAQARGLKVTGEATPHHLSLCAEEAPARDANYKVSPPLRSAGDREALRGALARGVISVIASDHAPHAAEEKARAYEEAPAGVIGLETTIGVIWSDLVGPGLLDLRRAIAAMTTGPAAALGLEEPALRVGSRAEVTLIDAEGEWTVEPERFASKGRNCPFTGRRLRGRAVATIVEGQVVMREGQVGGGRGQDPSLRSG
jgi:dihydroorotase